MRRNDISEAILRDLYYQQGLNQDQIAELLGCSQTLIWRRMVELGLPARPSKAAESGHLVPSHIFEHWTPTLAYVVGLVTTDGCLANDNPRLVIFTSTDRELIDHYQRYLGISAYVISAMQRTGRHIFSVKTSDPNYRAFLAHVGLTPAKSRTLGRLLIPDTVFPDFLRGCIDGDGSVWITHARGRPLLGIQIASGSEPFILWVQQTITQLTGLVGHIYQRPHRWDLRFNTRYAVALGEWIYYSSDVPCLSRKRAVWEKYRATLQSSR